jgi:urate oxidase
MYLRFVKSTGMDNIKIKSIFKNVTQYVKLAFTENPTSIRDLIFQLSHALFRQCKWLLVLKFAQINNSLAP